jgi:hypothetical protein
MLAWSLFTFDFRGRPRQPGTKYLKPGISALEPDQSRPITPKKL